MHCASAGAHPSSRSSRVALIQVLPCTARSASSARRSLRACWAPTRARTPSPTRVQTWSATAAAAAVGVASAAAAGALEAGAVVTLGVDSVLTSNEYTVSVRVFNLTYIAARGVGCSVRLRPPPPHGVRWWSTLRSQSRCTVSAASTARERTRRIRNAPTRGWPTPPSPSPSPASNARDCWTHTLLGTAVHRRGKGVIPLQRQPQL